MYFAEPLRSVTPGKSGLPSSRYVGNSGEALRITRIVSRKRQRIVQVCELRKRVRLCRNLGSWRADNVPAFRLVAGGRTTFGKRPPRGRLSLPLR